MKKNFFILLSLFSTPIFAQTFSMEQLISLSHKPINEVNQIIKENGFELLKIEDEVSFYSSGEERAEACDTGNYITIKYQYRNSGNLDSYDQVFEDYNYRKVTNKFHVGNSIDRFTAIFGNKTSRITLKIHTDDGNRFLEFRPVLEQTNSIYTVTIVQRNKK